MKKANVAMSVTVGSDIILDLTMKYIIKNLPHFKNKHVLAAWTPDEAHGWAGIQVCVMEEKAK